MAYYVDRNIKMTWWEKIYLPEIIKGMAITSRHFFMNLFGFVPFLLGTKKERPIMTVYYPEPIVFILNQGKIVENKISTNAGLMFLISTMQSAFSAGIVKRHARRKPSL